MESFDYLPLYRIRGDSIQCDTKECLSLDARVGHYYMFYINTGETKTGILFEYRNATINSAGLSLSNMPRLRIGSARMTVKILVKMMTSDDINVIRNDHCELSITADKSIKRFVINTWRKLRGFYTQEPTLNNSNLDRKSELQPNLKQGNGFYCLDCMEQKYPLPFRNTTMNLDGFASFTKSCSEPFNLF